MAKKHFILMADVIGSGESPGGSLGRHLKTTIRAANQRFKSAILSPLTVTLGDEFQGICRDAAAGVELILWLEHRLRQKPLLVDNSALPYQLRFVLHQGQIETSLNRERAHGMLGAGLTRARELLEAHRRGAPRIQMDLVDRSQASRLEQLFQVLDTLTADLGPDNHALAEAMLADENSVRIARKFDRHRTSIDRRRRTLKIDAILTLENLLRDLATAP